MTVLLLLLSLAPGRARAEESDWRADVRAEVTRQGERLADLELNFFMGMTPEESHTNCVGDMSDPICAAETALACRTWNDKALCESIAGENHRRDWTRWEEPMFDPSPPYQGVFFYSQDRPHQLYDVQNIPSSYLDQVVGFWDSYLELRGARESDRFETFTRYICWPTLPCPEKGGLFALACSSDFCPSNPLAIGLTIVVLREDDQGQWRIIDVMEQHFEAYDWIAFPAKPGTYITGWDPACNGPPMTPYCAALRWTVCDNLRSNDPLRSELSKFDDFENGRCLVGQTNPPAEFEFSRPSSPFLLFGDYPKSSLFLTGHVNRSRFEDMDWYQRGMEPPDFSFRPGDRLLVHYYCDLFNDLPCVGDGRQWSGLEIFAFVVRQVPDGTWHTFGKVFWLDRL